MDNLNIDNEVIEQELGNEEVIIDMPFDPNQIRVNTPPMNVGDIIDMLENGEIMLDTEFQRRADLWDNTKKSRFIESLLLKLPIPKFYFDGHDDNKWRVIDGLQRISTFKSFIKDNMPLKGLEFLKEFETKTFEGLPRDLQRRIKSTSLTVHILEKGTPDVVKFLLFSRINQSGLLLTPQEIRHAMHQGKASDLVYYLVNKDNDIGKSFIKVTENKIPTKRMEDRDFAARFVAFYVLSYENYKPDLDSFINAGMVGVNKLPENEIIELKSNFQKAMETAHAIFGNDAFRKRLNVNDQRKPINKALFEVLSVSFARCSDQQRDILIMQKEFFKEKLRELHKKLKFIRAITQGTALKDNVEQRFKDIQELIKVTLNFQKGINTVYAILGEDAVEKINRMFGTSEFRQLESNKFFKEFEMFNTLSISLGECTEEENKMLIKRKGIFLNNLKNSTFAIKFEFKTSEVEVTFTNLSMYDRQDIFDDIKNIIKITLEHA